MRNFMSLAAISLGAALTVSAPGHAQSVTGAGATFPAPIYSKWADSYSKATGVKVNYQSVGSGAGIKQIKAKTVDFGASDMPLKDEELKADGLMQFPTVIGGVVPVINIKGINPGQVKLTGQALADIYLGKITKWNDPALTAMNPGVPLPDAAIAPVAGKPLPAIIGPDAARGNSPGATRPREAVVGGNRFAALRNRRASRLCARGIFERCLQTGDGHPAECLPPCEPLDKSPGERSLPGARCPLRACPWRLRPALRGSCAGRVRCRSRSSGCFPP